MDTMFVKCKKCQHGFLIIAKAGEHRCPMCKEINEIIDLENRIKRFYVNRNKVDGTEYEKGLLIEGVVFSDGTTVIKWLSDVSSISIFKSFKEFDTIHGEEGHPEYNSEIIWIDENETI